MQFYDLAQTSLAKSGSSVVEEYIPLWASDGTTVSSTAYGITMIGQSCYIQNGSTASTGGWNTPSATLFTLNSNYSPNTTFALECSISGGWTEVGLADFSGSGSGTWVTQVTTTSNSMTVVRSAQFKLIPGHSYGIQLSNTQNGGTAYLSSVHLIVFGQ